MSSDHTQISCQTCEDRQRKKTVYASYAKNFALAIVVITPAYILANFVNDNYPTSYLWIKTIQIIGLSLDASVLGERAIQTWSGETPAENLDRKLLKIAFFIGLFLTAFSFELSPATRQST